MSHYNFEVKFKDDGCLKQFYQENSYLIPKIKKMVKMRKSEYIFSFENKRTPEAVYKEFSKCGGESMVSDKDFRVTDRKYAQRRLRAKNKSKIHSDEEQLSEQDQGHKTSNWKALEELIKKEES